MRNSRRAFTLVELLVVIGIIGVLISILVPVVSKVRRAATETKARAQLATLSTAIQRYYDNNRAYPGPIPQGGGRTGAENLVLALTGGLNSSGAYQADMVGGGPLTRTPQGWRRDNPYMDVRPGSPQMSPANGQKFADSNGITANDTEVPEFLDPFDPALPILYLRARVGSAGIVSVGGSTQYDLNDVLGYTASNIGRGQHGLRQVGTATQWQGASEPYDALLYLGSPSQPAGVGGLSDPRAVPREVDRFILISAGVDGRYGTKDDICNFGGVVP